jgi:hypothetical protein
MLVAGDTRTGVNETKTETRHCPLLPWRPGCRTGLILREQSSQAVAATRAAYDP